MQGEMVLFMDSLLLLQEVVLRMGGACKDWCGGGAGRVAVGLVGWQARKQLLPSSQSMGSKKKVERKDISLLWLRKHW